MALIVQDEQMEQALDALVVTEGVSRRGSDPPLDPRPLRAHRSRSARRGENEPAECAMGRRARPARAVVSEAEYLDLEDLLSIVRTLGIGPVRDLGLLDSAVARPWASAFAEDAYPTIELKAAAPSTLWRVTILSWTETNGSPGLRSLSSSTSTAAR